MTTISRQLRATDKTAWIERAERFIPGGVNSSLRAQEPRLAVVRAAGAYFEDADGASYLDYQAGFGPPILGHGHPLVIDRIQDTLRTLDLVGVGVTPQEIELAAKLVEHVPSVEKVLLCNSGSEATYHALRLARAATGRTDIIKFQGCYHGFHDAIALNVISPPDKLGRHDPLSEGSLADVQQHTHICEFNNLDQVAALVEKHRGAIAAIILEPVPHNIGCVLPVPGFLEGLREIASQHGIVLIFDEVITGFRHGLGGYQKLCGVTPDLSTLGKAMANGYPIAALGGRAGLMDRFNTRSGGTVFFAGTYNGHPLNCAAALATIEVLEDPRSYHHLFQLGERIRCGLREIMERHKVKAQVTGIGSVFLTYFLEGPVRSYTDLLRNDADLFVRYRRKLIERGIYKLPMNLKRNHISLAHTSGDIDRTLEACEDVIREIAG